MHQYAQMLKSLLLNGVIDSPVGKVFRIEFRDPLVRLIEVEELLCVVLV